MYLVRGMLVFISKSKYFIKILRQRDFLPVADVGVDVCGGRDIRMPEPLFDIVDVPTFIDKDACG